MELAVKFDNASTAKEDLRKTYEKCNDIPQENSALIGTFLKQESDKDYEMHLMHNRAKEETRVHSLPLDQPLNSYGLHTLLMSSESDTRITTALEAASEEVGSDLARIGSYSGLGTLFLHQVNFVVDSCTRNKEHALTLSWERIPRLAFSVRGAEAGVHGPAVAEQEIPITDDAGGTEAAGGSNAPAMVLRKDHDAARAEYSARGGKSLADMSVDTELAIHVQEEQEPPFATQSVSNPDPLSYAKPQSKQDVAHQVTCTFILTRSYFFDIIIIFKYSYADMFSLYRRCRSSKEKGVTGNQDSEKSTPSPPITRSPGSIYQPGWGVPNSCRLDIPEAFQDVVDHIAPPGYFSELRHLPNDEFLSQYNIKLARQVAMGSQLRLRFEQEAKLLKKSVAQELEDLRMRFSGLKVGNAQLSQQVSVLQAQVMGEKRIMAAFEDFKKHEDERVNAQCAEMDARLDTLSVDFDKELYPHMLTAIAGRRWVIGHGLRLAVMKCAESTKLRQAFANVVSARIAKGMSEGLKYSVEHGKAGLELTAVEAYDPEADNKYVAALHNLKDLNYPLIDELEQLKDAPLDVIMVSLYLDSDIDEDAPQSICDLRPSSSQLKIPVYPEVRNPKNPWACKDEILLEDSIAANISRAEKKKKSRVVCRTHGVGSAHHARSDGISVLVPTVAPQGLQILLADAATQTEDEGSSRLLRSKSLPALFTLDLP
ncbi:hypothetical protein Tco_0401775 [Tanacetum coccineum]